MCIYDSPRNNMKIVENGLTQAVHLTWLLVNRVHVLISQYNEEIVQTLICKVQENSVASGLLLQAIAARCQCCLKDEFALNIYKMLSLSHESQSGALVFLICRIIGKLEPAIAVRFANLATERCKMLAEVSPEDIKSQLSKEDLQVALESLHRDKDTKPLILKQHMPVQDSGPKPDFVLISDRLITMVQYWEHNFYTKPIGDILGKGLRKPIESLLISLSRLEVVNNIALIPPIAWSYVEVTVKNDTIQKIDLPLQALQDMDVLESFLFRVNLLGWSCKKQFEEIWVGLLGALPGNGTHWAVRGIAQLLATTAPALRRRPALHLPRTRVYLTDGG
ncbi:Huntingtin [Papilio xuthus]|uniref:Huntingtin n=1 Tax=Papilio xuthus TaxID=66420 RepID=A0A0N1I607_PAPXU|nr:Huntingtin [Papilio xuthus]